MEFSAASCIRFGWETFKKRPWFFIGVTLLTAVIEGIFNTPYRDALNAHASLYVEGGAYLISILLNAFLYMGLYHLALKAHDDVEKVSWKDLWAPQHYVWYVLTSLLMFFIVTVGLLFLIVPGFILLMVFFFPFYPVIEFGLNPIEALKYSKRITQGHRMELFGFFVANIAIVILGIVCLVVGILVAMPVLGLATAHAYRTLQKMADQPVAMA
jgi:uncharacterized membrane protein